MEGNVPAKDSSLFTMKVGGIVASTFCSSRVIFCCRSFRMSFRSFTDLARLARASLVFLGFGVIPEDN